METDKPTAPVPFIPSAQPTIFANVAFAAYVPANGAIMLHIRELRNAPVLKVGDAAVFAQMEHARFALTPRALRELANSVELAIAAYGAASGIPLPTVDGFNAAGALTTIAMQPTPEPAASD